MNNYKLYVHIAPNGKRYYGITSQEPKKRWKNGSSYKSNKHFANAINKYGWDNIEHIILFDSLTEYEAKELEQYYIQWYDTAKFKYGYNQSLGGEGNNGCNHTQESKKKMSEAKKGKNNPMHGKRHSDKTIQKMRDIKKGKKISEETRKKMSDARKDKTGKNNANAKPVICVTTGRIFFTVGEGAIYYNIKNTSICNCCKGRSKSAGKHNGQKLVWKYVNYKHNKTYKVVNMEQIEEFKKNFNSIHK